MSYKTLCLPYTTVAPFQHQRLAVLVVLAMLVGFSLSYAILINAVTGTQYTISGLNKEVIRAEAEVAKNQALLLKRADRSIQPNSGGKMVSGDTLMQNISSDLSYIYTESVFADASRPNP